MHHYLVLLKITVSLRVQRIIMKFYTAFNVLYAKFAQATSDVVILHSTRYYC